MSEMVRGSPRFLLAAGRREAMTLTFDDLSLGGGKDWDMDTKPHALLPLVCGWVAVNKLACLFVPRFPLCKMSITPQTS